MEINKDKLNNLKNIKIIDLRDEKDYLKKHLDGAINIPFFKLLIHYEELLNKNQKYLLVCERGIRSKKACFILNKHGFHTYSLSGGMKKI